jgi:uncharacterized protein YprB with RNaseH-like and TPR domain
MLASTFCHLSGVSLRTERHLWESGLRDWDEFLARAAPPLGPTRLRAAREQLELSRARLAAGDPRWFCERLSSKEQWRIFPEFRSRIAYLDIETTGLDRDRDAITTIALYDGKRIRTYVQGQNLDDFARDIRDYALLVTYNGKCFDVPFLEAALNIRLPQAHIDLRHVLHSLGLRGGLKGCERQLGLSRGELEGVDGFFAVLLWRDYLRRGRAASLETLLAYNVEDAVNLETLMVMAYNRKLAETPFADRLRLSLPERPAIPFAPDPDTVRRLRARLPA